MNNPWIDQHIDRETEFLEGNRLVAEYVVRNEYRGMEAGVECDREQGGCGSTAYYKATIGAMKCPDCGSLFDTQGDRY